MQAKKRYILVLISCAFLAYCYFGGYRIKRILIGNRHFSAQRAVDDVIEIPSILASFYSSVERNGLPEAINYQIDTNNANSNAQSRAIVTESLRVDSNMRTVSASDRSKHLNNKVNRDDTKLSVPAADGPDAGANEESAADPMNVINNAAINRNRPCRMETCFDYSKCNDVSQQFLVYVYPQEAINGLGNSPTISLNYQKILSAIMESRYYTADPERACLFVLGIDTLDRDSLSEDYVRNIPARLQRLSHWNNGRNHVIFNLYSGTWPDYAENSLGFDTGRAILAKASMSVRQIRPGFDISIPLFHKQHPLRAGNTGFVTNNNFPTNKKYLLAFKGKR